MESKPIQSSLKEEKKLETGDIHKMVKALIEAGEIDDKFLPPSLTFYYAFRKGYQSSLTPKSISMNSFKDFFLKRMEKNYLQYYKDHAELEKHMTSGEVTMTIPEILKLAEEYDKSLKSIRDSDWHEKYLEEKSCKEDAIEYRKQKEKELILQVEANQLLVDLCKQYQKKLGISAPPNESSASLKPNKLSDEEIEKMAEEYARQFYGDFTDNNTEESTKSSFIAVAQAIINKQNSND